MKAVFESATQKAGENLAQGTFFLAMRGWGFLHAEHDQERRHLNAVSDYDEPG